MGRGQWLGQALSIYYAEAPVLQPSSVLSEGDALRLWTDIACVGPTCICFAQGPGTNIHQFGHQAEETKTLSSYYHERGYWLLSRLSEGWEALQLPLLIMDWQISFPRGWKCLCKQS